MIESTYLSDDDHEENVVPSDEEDFERKLLMHCEAYALHEETSVGTSFDDDSATENEIESCGNFVLFQIDQTQQDDANVVYTTCEENETGVEIKMQRLCESCAMDLADISEFDQCPFCLAAKQADDSCNLRLDGSHDIHIEVSNSSDILDRKQHNTGVDCIKSMQEQQCRPSTTDSNSKDQFLKGIIATFLQQNKSAHGFASTTKEETNVEDIIAPRSKCNDNFFSPTVDQEIMVLSQNESCASSITDDASDRCLTADGGLSTHLKELKVSQAAIEKLALYSDLRRLEKLKKTEATPPTPTRNPVTSEAKKIGSGRFNGRSRVLKDLTIQHQHAKPNGKRFHQEPTYKTAAEEINVRYNLLQLERYYSQQQ
ncbi:hypothetical protein ACHAWC_007420 [Mediolabrus comicus]